MKQRKEKSRSAKTREDYEEMIDEAENEDEEILKDVLCSALGRDVVLMLCASMLAKWKTTDRFANEMFSAVRGRLEDAFEQRCFSGVRNFVFSFLLRDGQIARDAEQALHRVFASFAEHQKELTGLAADLLEHECDGERVMRFVQHSEETIEEMLNGFGALREIKRSHMQFLIEAGRKKPEIVVKTIQKFVDLVSHDLGFVRCAMLETLTEMTLKIAQKSSAEKHLQKVLKIVYERLRDINYHVRIKSIWALESIVSAGRATDDTEVEIFRSVQEKIFDKTAMVRKRALAFFVLFVSGQKGGRTLSKSALCEQSEIATETERGELDRCLRRIAVVEDAVKDAARLVQMTKRTELAEVVELLAGAYSRGLDDAFLRLKQLFPLIRREKNKTDLVETIARHLEQVIACDAETRKEQLMNTTRMLFYIVHNCGSDERDTLCDIVREMEKTHAVSRKIVFFVANIILKSNISEDEDVSVRVVEMVSLGMQTLNILENTLRMLTEKDMFKLFAKSLYLFWECHKKGLNIAGKADMVKHSLILLQKIDVPTDRTIVETVGSLVCDAIFGFSELDVVAAGIDTVYRLAEDPMETVLHILRTLQDSGTSLAKVLHVVGQIVLNQSAFLDTMEQRFSADESELGTSLSQVVGSIRRSLGEDEKDVFFANRDAVAYTVVYAKETEMLYGNTVLAQIVPIVLSVARGALDGPGSEDEVAATLALVKMCCTSLRFCTENIDVVFGLAARARSKLLRVNMLVSLCDIGKAFGSVLETHTERLLALLDDADADIRLLAMRVVATLALARIIKIRGFAGKIACIAGGAENGIRRIARAFLIEFSRREDAYVSLFIEIVLQSDAASDAQRAAIDFAAEHIPQKTRAHDFVAGRLISQLRKDKTSSERVFYVLSLLNVSEKHSEQLASLASTDAAIKEHLAFLRKTRKTEKEPSECSGVPKKCAY